MFWFDFHWQIQHVLNQLWWPINLLLLVVVVSLGYLSYKKPAYAVGLTIIMLPTYLFRSKVWFLPFTFLEICIWVIFLGWIITKFVKKDFSFNYPKKYRYPILLVLLAATISLVISPDLKSAAGLWKAYFIEPILFFLVLIDTLKTKKDKKIILWSLGILSLPIALLAIYQKFTGFAIFEPGWTSPDHRRVTSIFSSPNAIGLCLGPIIMIYLGWLIQEIKKLGPTILKIFILILALLAIIFSSSQGTILGLMAGTIFLMFFGWNKKYTSLLVIICLILIMLVPITRQKIWPVITLQDASGQNRIQLAQTAGNYLTQNSKNFVLGLGLLGFDKIQDQTRDPLKIEDLLYPHNIVLNFWVELGLLGLLAFTWLIVIFFKQVKNKIKNSPDWLTLGIAACIIALLVHGLVDVPYFKNDLAVLFWIIIGLI